MSNILKEFFFFLLVIPTYHILTNIFWVLNNQIFICIYNRINTNCVKLRNKCSLCEYNLIYLKPPHEQVIAYLLCIANTKYWSFGVTSSVLAQTAKVSNVLVMYFYSRDCWLYFPIGSDTIVPSITLEKWPATYIQTRNTEVPE